MNNYKINKIMIVTKKSLNQQKNAHKSKEKKTKVGEGSKK